METFRIIGCSPLSSQHREGKKKKEKRMIVGFSGRKKLYSEIISGQCVGK